MKLAQLITGVIGTSEWQESFAEYRPKYFGESVEASVGTITPEQCCNSLQVWTEDVYFPRRFTLTDKTFNDFPVYEASSGPLKVFFDGTLNQWVASDDLSATTYRALGSATACPQQSDWKVFIEGEFGLPILEQERVPYIEPEHMLECVPETFSIGNYKHDLIHQMCSMFDGKGASRACREVRTMIELVFADWDGSSNKTIRVWDAMLVPYLKTLDQWHQQVVSVLLRRTFDSRPEIEKSVRHSIQSSITSIRHLYQQRNFAKKDSRFAYLWI